ncbi:8178_t:CDS:2, partial [Cetraspora pellucida]
MIKISEKIKKIELISDENDKTFNWKELYSNILEKFEIKFVPESIPSELKPSKVQIFECDLVINLNDVFKKHKNEKNEINAHFIRIYADVVQLSNNSSDNPSNDSSSDNSSPGNSSLDSSSPDNSSSDSSSSGNSPSDSSSDNPSHNLEIKLTKNHTVILIVARRFEVKQGYQISINFEEGMHFELLIYTKYMPELFAKIEKKDDKQYQLLIYTASEPISKHEEKDLQIHKINSSKIGGLISLHSEKSKEKPILDFKEIPNFDSIILQRKSFIKILRFSLQIAVALSYNDTDTTYNDTYDSTNVTQSILKWITDICEKMKDKPENEFEMTKKLYNNAVTMQKQLKTRNDKENSNFNFVPHLKMKDYKDQMYKLWQFAESYEKRYYEIMKSESIDKQRLEELNDRLLNHKDTAEMHTFLKEAENKKLESAENLKKKTEENLQVSFEKLGTGIDTWLKEQKDSAKKELFFAVVDLSLCIVNVVMSPGNITNAVNTAKGAIDAAKNVISDMNMKEIENFETTAQDDIQKGQELFNNLSSKANKIVDITKKLKSTENTAKDLHVQTKNMISEITSLDEKIDERLETDQKGIMLDIDLEPIKEGVDNLYKFLESIESDIDGAKEYLEALNKYVGFIDKYAKTKIDANEKRDTVLQYEKQEEIDGKIEHRLKERIQTLELETKSRNNEFKLLLFEHLINIRYYMTLFMEKYCHAFRYWSLSESKLELSVLKNFTEIDVNIMFKDLDDISSSKPQLKRTTIEFDEKIYIDKFKQDKSVELTIMPDCRKLNKYARLRIHAFRVYLDGAGPEGEQIALFIRHSGKFSDRDKKNQTYEFMSESSKRGFEYRVYNGYDHKFDIDPKYIDLDNIYYDEQDKEYHFTPTPFSQWTISL